MTLIIIITFWLISQIMLLMGGNKLQGNSTVIRKGGYNINS